jgi:hypothetical protein
MVQPINFEVMKEAVSRQLPQGSDEASRSRAARLYRQGEIVSARFGVLDYNGGQIWADSTKRSQARFVHGFLFFSDWHGTLLRDAEVNRSAAATAIQIVRTWASAYADGTKIPAVSHHDETTAQRLIQLTSLIHQLKALVNEEDFIWLTDLAVNTADLLASDEFHATGNNHGMFQDLALLYFSVMCEETPEADRVRFFDVSTRRLHSYFSSSFTADGVHVENTPTYHLMVCRHVHGVLEILSKVNHEHADYYRRLLSAAAGYASHALMPNGMYPPVSDTTQQSEVRAARQNIFDSEEFAYAASAGKLGSKPQRRTMVLPDSGYAIYRSAWGDPKATFAFFSAAYNANYHKHSDDLSLFLRSDGVDLLSEAGGYGYDYKDPLTKFGYSSYAHNCLVVDGVSLPRTDESSHLTTLEAHEVRDDGYRVTGRTQRLKDTTHSRTVDIREEAGIPRLDISDAIECHGEHSFELLWNLGPEVEPVVHGNGFELFHNGRKLMDLQFDADVPTYVSVHKGEKRPKYLGWRFPRFGEAIPSNVVKIAFTGSSAHLRTRIRLAGFSYLDRGLREASSDWKRSGGRVGLNYLSVPATSEAGSGKLAVVFTAIHQPGDFTFNYKKSVDQTGTNALYILDDFGDQGAYYLADHGDRSIFDSTQSLIRAELHRLGLTAADLITAGSSKGGSAAVLHGIAAGAGRIIVGAPQVKIGSFLQTPHPNILRFIMGGTDDESVRALDQVLFDAIDGLEDSTRISIVVGEADHHYRNHVLPLKEYADRHGKNIDVTVLPGLPHAEIGSVYRAFLVANIEQELLGSRERVVTHLFHHAGDDSTSLHLDVHAPSGWEIASRLFCGSDPVDRTPFGESRTLRWSSLPPGRYRARVFLRNPENSDVPPFTTKWLTVS